jgi:hypothetical protein
MNREDVLVKLLAVEPEDEGAIVRVTGWGRQETLSLLQKLVREGRLTYTNWTNQHTRLYSVRAA